MNYYQYEDLSLLDYLINTYKMSYDLYYRILQKWRTQHFFLRCADTPFSHNLWYMKRTLNDKNKI